MKLSTARPVEVIYGGMYGLGIGRFQYDGPAWACDQAVHHGREVQAHVTRSVGGTVVARATLLYLGAVLRKVEVLAVQWKLNH